MYIKYIKNVVLNVCFKDFLYTKINLSQKFVLQLNISEVWSILLIIMFIR